MRCVTNENNNNQWSWILINAYIYLRFIIGQSVLHV